MSIRRLIIAFLFLTCLGLGFSRSAVASNPSDQGCSQDDECREHFVKGATFYKQQDYGNALKEFQEAYSRRQTPILLANIGRTLQKLGRPKEALEYYERCQEAAKSDSELQEKIQGYIAETKALLAHPVETPADKQPSSVAPNTPPDMPPSPADKPKPIYKKGWFIATMVIGSVVVVGALTTGIILGTRANSNPPLDPDVMIIRPTF